MRCPVCRRTTIVKHDAPHWMKQKYLCLSCQSIHSRTLFLGINTVGLSLIAGCVLLSLVLLPLPMQGFLKLISGKPNHETEIAIILGRGAESREELALVASSLWASQPNLSFFVSGMTDAPEIINLLVEMGVPETQIKGERCSQTTWENGLFSEILIDSREANEILLITDQFHMLRAILVFRKFGFNVKPYTIKLDKEAYFSSRTTRHSLREYAALINYSLSGKFRLGAKEETLLVKSRAKQRIHDWNCYLK